MEEKEKRGYEYTRTAKPDGDLREYERTFLARVFRGEETRSLSSLQNKFYSAIPELRRQIEEALVAEGLLPRSPQSVRTSYTILAVVVLVLGVASLFLLGVFLGNNAGLACFPMAAIVGTAIALFIAARHMPRKTAKGAEASAKWRAFKTYLQNIKQSVSYTHLDVYKRQERSPGWVGALRSTGGDYQSVAWTLKENVINGRHLEQDRL